MNVHEVIWILCQQVMQSRDIGTLHMPRSLASKGTYVHVVRSWLKVSYIMQTLAAGVCVGVFAWC